MQAQDKYLAHNSFPGPTFPQGRYCGTIIDVGTALTAKVLRNNGQQFHRYTYRALKPYGLVKPDKIEARDEFDTGIEEKLGPAASAKYFESDQEIVTPTLDWYEDDEKHKNNMPEVDDITSEEMDNCIGVEIIISHGDTVYQGCVRSRKHDVEGNTIGRANSNPILDTQTYELEFKDGIMSTYSANVISENMYTRCDEEVQKCLLFG